MTQASLLPRGTAFLSPCERYRYELTRELGGEREAVFVMLNPSTADAEQDDPTIRRCVDFARQWKCTRLRVVNLFAWRATDPRALVGVADPVGPENDATIFRAARSAAMSGGVLVLAWGAERGKVRGSLIADRARAVRAALPMFRAHTLGATSDGSPRHPLFVRADAALAEVPRG